MSAPTPIPATNSTTPAARSCAFYIDNVLQEEWSGINAPQMESYPVAVGNHTLERRYTKDGSVNTGSDRVWVDDIMLTGGVPTG